MLSLSWWAYRITALFEKVYPLNSSQKEVIEYGFVVMFSALTGLVLIVFLASILGLLFPTIIVVLAASTLRLSAGGAHCSAPWRCNLLGVLVFPTLGYMVKLISHCRVAGIWAYVVLAMITAIGAVLWHAPVLTVNKPLSMKRRQRLRQRSCVTVFGISMLVLLFLSWGLTYEAVGLATGLLWQGFTLLPLGWQVIGSLDRFLSGWVDH